jgi:hypothetical protein
VVRNYGVPDAAENTTVTNTVRDGVRFPPDGSSKPCQLADRSTRRVLRPCLGTVECGYVRDVIVAVRVNEVGRLLDSATVESPVFDGDTSDSTDI